MIEQRFLAAKTFEEFIRTAEANVELWRAVYEHAKAPDDLVQMADAMPCKRHLLVMLEDWCGDAVNTIPALARLAEGTTRLELRVLERDRNPDLMEGHLTDGARAIPVVIILDEDFEEMGWWGPRPRMLQSWFVAEGQLLEKGERYKQLRRWYARDKGRSAMQEILSVATQRVCAGWA